MPTRVEYVKPDLVTTSQQPRPDWAELAPCPNCGTTPHQAPEGVNANGDPHWTFPHCWKCGHRPGINVAVDMRVMREQFEAFQQFVRQNTPQHPTLTAPTDPDVIANLQAEMAAMKQEMAASKHSQHVGGNPLTMSGEPVAPPPGMGTPTPEGSD